MFILEGTSAQRQVAQAALDRCTYPWERLTRRVPIGWRDLSREGALGLAWTNGKIELDLGLEGRPELAAEVLLSEAAHILDFFLLTGKQRADVVALLHGVSPQPGGDVELDATQPVFADGHGWFDVGGYRSWLGEALMGAFVSAFSDVRVTIRFEHVLPAVRIPEFRAVVLGEDVVPPFPPVEEQLSDEVAAAIARAAARRGMTPVAWQERRWRRWFKLDDTQ